MIVALSPYHLTTREAPALAAALLATKAVTLVPTPQGGRHGFLDAAETSPAYARLMECWRWSLPLWRSGVLASSLAGDDAGEDVAGVVGRIGRDDALLPLRGFVQPTLFDTERPFLSAAAADLLKGGPDPAFTVPVAAGLDRFASRHGVMVMRSAPASVAQQAEARLGTRAFAIGLPILMRGSAEQIMAARGLLAPSLGPLREAVAAIAADHAGAEDGSWRPSTAALADMNDAARAYTEAFGLAREEVLRPLDPDDERPVESTVSLTALVLPGNAVLRSSLQALRAVGIAGSRGGTATRALARSVDDPGDARPVLSLVVKVLGRG